MRSVTERHNRRVLRSRSRFPSPSLAEQERKARRKAYEEGVQAAQDGKTLEDNPYPEDSTTMYPLWAKGFTDTSYDE